MMDDGQTIDFLPASYRRRQADRRYAGPHLLLAAALAAALIAWGYAEHRQTTDLAWQTHAVQAEARAVHRQQANMAAMRRTHERLVRQVKLQRDLAQPLRDTRILAVIGKLMPGSIALTHLKMARIVSATNDPPRVHGHAVKAGASASANVPRLHLDVRGLAPNDLTVANFLGRLKFNALFTDVKIHYSRATTVHGVTGRLFELSMEVPLNRTFVVRAKGGLADAR